MATPTVIGSVSSELVLNPVAMYQLLKSPSGVVGVTIAKTGTQVVVVARNLAPFRTGKLRSSIGVIGFGLMGDELTLEVAANIRYAYYVHEGKGESIIRPRRGKVLKFPVEGGGVEVFTPNPVVSPARPPNPFLFRAAVRVVCSRFPPCTVSSGYSNL
jgi:hypothetical protein